MRGTQPARLLGAASLAVMVTALSFADAAQAESREARMCATQTESLADQRIATCAEHAGAGRDALIGEALGLSGAHTRFARLRLRGVGKRQSGDHHRERRGSEQPCWLGPTHLHLTLRLNSTRAENTRWANDLSKS